MGVVGKPRPGIRASGRHKGHEQRWRCSWCGSWETDDSMDHRVDENGNVTSICALCLKDGALKELWDDHP